jgi:hypothetical protein
LLDICAATNILGITTTWTASRNSELGLDEEIKIINNRADGFQLSD